MHGSCQFLGLDCFSRPNVLPKLDKITDLAKVKKYEDAGLISACPKLAK